MAPGRDPGGWEKWHGSSGGRRKTGVVSSVLGHQNGLSSDHQFIVLVKDLCLDLNPVFLHFLNNLQPHGQSVAKAHHAQVELDQAKEKKAVLDGKTVTVTAKAGAGGKLFGAVTAKEIALALKEQYQIDVDKKKVSLDSEIKAFGTYDFELKLHTGVSASMKVMVKE